MSRVFHYLQPNMLWVHLRTHFAGFLFKIDYLTIAFAIKAPISQFIVQLLATVIKISILRHMFDNLTVLL